MVSKGKNNPKSSGKSQPSTGQTLKTNKLSQLPMELIHQLEGFSFWKNYQLHKMLIFLFAFLLYANTVNLQYAVDDSIVIQRNMFTKKGWKGMLGIWSKDTFVGFFGDDRNLVSGGRYRPFTVAMFAMENQIFGKKITNESKAPVNRVITVKEKDKASVLAQLGNPKYAEISKSNDTLNLNLTLEPGAPIPDKDGDINYLGKPGISHAINAILFGLLCLMLYMWILSLFDPQNEGKTKVVFIALATALLYAAHPLHTEAVANIKGRDEIMVTLFSVLASYWVLKSIGSKWNLLYMSAAVISFILGLFSKESAIPFLVVIPASLYFFIKDIKVNTIVLKTIPFMAVVLFFWFGIRNPILNFKDKNPPAPELMNDPFMKMVPTGNGMERKYIPFETDEKMGMILYTWLDYVRLLVLPHPLTNDYYPKHIGGKKDNFPTTKDPRVLLSIILHLGLGYLAIRGILKKDPIAFALIFYAATFSVVSNLFFPIGTTMAERFMFMPSIAFSLLSAIGLAQLATVKGSFSLQNTKIPLVIMGVVLGLYSFKTITRNADWYDDYSLFTRDIMISPSSAKLNNAVSGVLQDSANRIPLNDPEKLNHYVRALYHSKEAVELHPTYNNAWLLLGNAHVFISNIKESMADSAKAKLDFQKSNELYVESKYRLDSAITAYQEVKRLRPDHPDVPINLTAAHRSRGKLLGEKLGKVSEALADLEEANKYSKGNDLEVLRLLGVAYGITGMTYQNQGLIAPAIQNHQRAIQALEKALALSPNYAPTWYNMEIAYRQLLLLDAANANIYTQKVIECNEKWKSIDPNYSPM